MGKDRLKDIGLFVLSRFMTLLLVWLVCGDLEGNLQPVSERGTEDGAR